MSRPRKNLRLHELHGTKPHETKIVMSAFSGGRPRFPKHLCAAAKAEFKRCAQLLEDRGTLTPSDETSLAIYAEVYSRWVQAKREIGKELLITTEVADSHGQVRIVKRLNPLLKIVESSEQRLLALAKNIGLTQVDLARCKQTSIDSSNEPPPGSMGDLHPELFDKNGKYIKPQQREPIVFTPLIPDGSENDGN